MPVEMIQRFTHEQRRQRREQIAAAVLTGKPMSDIAQEFGVSLGTVINSCKEQGASKTAIKRAQAIQVAEIVRTGKTVADASIEFGLSADIIYRACRDAGVELRRGPRKGSIKDVTLNTVVTREEWAALDWTKRDIELAEHLGVSRERVRQVRIALQKPRSPDHCTHQYTINSRLWLAENHQSLMGLHLRDIRQLCPFKPQYSVLARLCDKLGIIYLRSEKVGSRITKENLQSFCSETSTGCWEWNFKKTQNGYAFLGSRRYVHRFAYELFNGKVADGLWVLHTCDNSRCVNPEHLYSGTPADNARDRVVRGRDGNAKLKPEQVKEIRELRAMGGYTLAKLAGMFGVNICTIRSIVIGKTWNHVDAQLAWQSQQQQLTIAKAG